VKLVYDGRVRESWDRRIRRAEELAATAGPASSLLTFYGRLLRSQKDVYDSFNRLPPSGSLEQDLPLVMDRGSALLREVADHGPDQLVVLRRSFPEHRLLRIQVESRRQLREGSVTHELLEMAVNGIRPQGQLFPSIDLSGPQMPLEFLKRRHPNNIVRCPRICKSFH